ncbi:CLUMA_CG017728, isoform A [Clunio marinus]|uniref:CLUMA_CG017728, isoform A n=1 Tax=Clunio marinus TaxID=568069 RepID=A0A1J1IX34_9DIPT|nr:CLUMA_CG017728, isoform A [Clunio marinus]
MNRSVLIFFALLFSIQREIQGHSEEIISTRSPDFVVSGEIVDYSVAISRSAEVTVSRTPPTISETSVTVIQSHDSEVVQVVTHVQSSYQSSIEFTSTRQSSFNFDSSSATSIIGNNVLFSNENGIERVIYGLFAILSIVSGEVQQYPPPFYVSYFDDAYPSPPDCLTSSNNIGCQAKVVIAIIASLTNDIENVLSDFEDYETDTSADIDVSCQNLATSEAVTSQLSSIRNAIQSYVDNNSEGVLIEIIASNLAQEFDSAVASLQTLIDNMMTCSDTLTGSLSSNHVKIFSGCDEDSTYPELCDVGGTKYTERLNRNVIRYTNFIRRRAVQVRETRLTRFEENAATAVELFSSIFSFIRTSFNRVRGIFSFGIKINALNLQSKLVKLLDTYSSVISNTIPSITSILEETEQEVENIQKSTSFDFYKRTNNFIEEIITNSNDYPCCNEYAQSTVELQAKFASEFSDCIKESYNVWNELAYNVTLQLARSGERFNEIDVALDKCIRLRCDKVQCLNQYIARRDSTKIINCIYGVVKSTYGVQDMMYLEGNFTIDGLRANSSIAISEAQECSNAAVEAADTELEEIKAAYEDCKVNRWCDAMATTTTTPAPRAFSCDDARRLP